MATHQSISGVTDEAFLQRMVSTYPERYNNVFWAFLTEQVGAYLPPQPVIVDLGCGPGLFLRDWSRMPLQDYLAWREQNRMEEPAESRPRGFRLFPVHNKYTTEDWQWLLAEAGFTICAQTPAPPTHEIFVTKSRQR